MFFDTSGNPAYNGKVVKEYVWSVANDSALPSWLSMYGTSAIATYYGMGASNGRLRCTTKAATPSLNDAAGVQTAFNIDATQFEEIGIYLYSLVTDGTATTQSLAIEHSDSTTGTSFFSSDTGAGQAVLRVKPSITKYPPWQPVAESNNSRRKDIGLTIRPRTREVILTTGDPYEGAGIVGYDKGNWVAPPANTKPLQAAVFVKGSAAQRYMEFAKIKIRFVSN